MRILLVDDEVEFVTTLAERLELRGVDAHYVFNGTEALKILTEQDFDLAVVDLKMPGIGGDQLMAKAAGIKPDLKFILLTGHMNGACDPGQMAAGRCFHLVKPVDIDELLEVIQKTMKG